MAETPRDYSSIYAIKDFAMKEIAPKYFDMLQINQLNVGLLGYVTEVMGNTTEDVFNTVSTYVKEIFPNQAQIPETLYSFAANLQLDHLMATPSQLDMVLLVNENDINSLGARKESYFEFIVDKKLIIDVEGQQFMPDYDIRINSKPYAGDYIYTAQYVFDFKNSLSEITNPYIKTTRINLNGNKYLALFISTHRVNRFEQVETIINNDKINFPVINVDFIDQLANFEVFYRPPGVSTPIQLKKRMYGQPPLAEPFCFYRIKDENLYEISFTMRDNYFQPEFNSELTIVTYTTTGEAGNFPEYKGTNISVIPSSDRFDYNNNIILFAVPQGESAHGRDRLSLEELRSKIIERNSTSGAYNNENDLQLYFANYQYQDNNKVLFIKKRDDALERVFSAFSLFKDNKDNYYPTNTLNVNLYKKDFDLEYEQSNRFILKAGHLFKYLGDSRDLLEMIPDMMIKDNPKNVNEEFLFTNPFLITLQKSPSIVGFYLNSVNSKIPVEYTYVNSNSLTQFICNNIQIKRNAIIGENKYTIVVNLTPTGPLEYPIINEETKVPTGNLKLMLAIEDAGTEICYTELQFKTYDEQTNFYTYETTIETDDYMTLAQKFTVLNMNNIVSGDVQSNTLIPMNDCIINVHAFFKYPALKLAHKYDYLAPFQEYSLTNTYSTRSVKANFIIPLDIMRARVKYRPYQHDNGTGVMIDDYYMLFNQVPLAGAVELYDSQKFENFINLIYSQHDYLEEIVEQKTNNYGIDLKFYNTFGRSKYFVVGEDGQILDKTNISIRFRVAPTVGTIESDLITNLKIFIKNYIEGINNQGYNAIYISNLIQAIENNFPEVKYLRFIRINNYDSSVQAIENRGLDINNLTKEERLDYVPEYLTITLDNIFIDIIRS